MAVGRTALNRHSPDEPLEWDKCSAGFRGNYGQPPRPRFSQCSSRVCGPKRSLINRFGSFVRHSNAFLQWQKRARAVRPDTGVCRRRSLTISCRIFSYYYFGTATLAIWSTAVVEHGRRDCVGQRARRDTWSRISALSCARRIRCEPGGWSRLGLLDHIAEQRQTYRRQQRDYYATRGRSRASPHRHRSRR
jgi:hypothetical protein